MAATRDESTVFRCQWAMLFVCESRWRLFLLSETTTGKCLG